MAKERAERSFGYIAGDDGEISEEELKKVAQRMAARGGKGGPGGQGGRGKGMSKGGKGGNTDTGGGTKPKRPEIEE